MNKRKKVKNKQMKKVKIGVKVCISNPIFFKMAEVNQEKV